MGQQFRKRSNGLLKLALASVLVLSMSAASQTAAPAEKVGPEGNQAVAMQAAVADLPEAPSASGSSSSRSDDAAKIGGERFVVSSPADGRNSVENPRTVDGKFILLQAVSAVALVADVETTVRDLQGSNSIEINPLFGQHPTRARLYSINVPLDLLSFYVSYRYKKRDPNSKAWKVGPALFIAVHTAAAINNLVVGPR